MYHLVVKNQYRGDFYICSENGTPKSIRIKRMGHEIRYPNTNRSFVTDDFVLGLVVQGQARISSAETKIDIQEGDFFVRGLDSPFNFKIVGEEVFHFCLISIQASLGEIPEEFHKTSKFQSFNNHIFKELVEHILSMLCKTPASPSSLANSYIPSIFEVSKRLIEDAVQKKSAAQLKLEKLLSIMNQQIESEWEIEDLCQEAGISKAQTCRIFKKYLKQSPSAYWRSLRLQQAEYLLRNTQYSVKEIAYKIGFKDPLYFSKIFKNKTGLSPRAYRGQMVGL